MLPKLGKRVCKYCDAPVPHHGIDHHCGDMKCKFKYMEEQKLATKRYWDDREAQHNVELNAYAQRFAESVGVGKDEVGVTTVPSSQYVLKPVPNERVTEFTAHLSHCLETLDTEADDRVFKTPRKTEVPEHLAHIAIQACTTCRGDCCKQGFMMNAFIRRTTLKRVLANVEAVTKQNLVETYVQYIPENSIQYSCIFHTDQGCNLVDELRADICGDFFCLPASNYIVKLTHQTLPKYHVMAAARNCDVDIVRIMDNEGNEIEQSDSLT